MPAEEEVEPVVEQVVQAAETPASIVRDTKGGADFSAATKAQPKEVVSAELNKPWAMADVKQIQSTPDNKAPSQEDTIEGRYAGVLFTSAS